MKLSFGLTVFAASMSFSTLSLAGDFQEGVRVLDGGDSVAALSHFKRCSDKGELRCQVAYASFLERGEGVPQDLQSAFDLYSAAARNGDATAQLNLGEFYEKGVVVPVNPVEAFYWYSLAAAQGNNWALSRKREIGKQLSPEEISRVETLLKETANGRNG